MRGFGISSISFPLGGILLSELQVELDGNRKNWSETK